MARQARQLSASGIYHAVFRGVNKQEIFECVDDFQQFIGVLRKVTKPVEKPDGSTDTPPCILYAYCLMGNHVHLLLKEGSKSLDEVMKIISVRYVKYYNWKYGRCGHLLQDRFSSQPVDNLDYFVTLMRYIHQNPVKAGITEHVRDYRWSSWHEYLGTETDGVCATSVLLSRMNINDLNELVEVCLDEEDELGLLEHDMTPAQKMKEYNVSHFWTFVSKLCKKCPIPGCPEQVENITEFQHMPKGVIKYLLFEANKKGFSKTFLSRNTGISYRTVCRAGSAKNDAKAMAEWKQQRDAKASALKVEDFPFVEYEA